MAIVYSKQKITSLHEILHIWSIALTFAFLLYKPSSSNDLILLKTISIFRSVRLLFPMFLQNNITKLMKELWLITFKVKKILFIMLVTLVMIGLFGQQIYSNAIGNRCRSLDACFLNSDWSATD
jgi:hypothetical protein